MSDATAEDFPVLEGWVNPSDAGAILGVSRQTVHQMILNREFKTTHRFGRGYAIKTDEVEKMAETRVFKSTT